LGIGIRARTFAIRPQLRFEVFRVLARKLRKERRNAAAPRAVAGGTLAPDEVKGSSLRQPRCVRDAHREHKGGYDRHSDALGSHLRTPFPSLGSFDHLFDWRRILVRTPGYEKSRPTQAARRQRAAPRAGQPTMQRKSGAPALILETIGDAVRRLGKFTLSWALLFQSTRKVTCELGSDENVTCDTPSRPIRFLVT
jgi:hypothetical protein